MNSKKQRLIWILAILLIAAAAITTTVVYNTDAKDEGADSMLYPDLNQVKVDQVPDDFDVDNQPMLGNKNAPIQIVEFADYKCLYCKLWTETVFPVVKEQFIDTGKASFVYLDFSFLGPDSHLAALAGETLFQQNPEFFWKYHALMTARQGDESTEWATYEFIVDLVAKEIPEVDMKLFKQELKEQKYIVNVKKDFEIGRKHDVGGTPTIFINGKLYEEPTIEQIQSIIDGL
ncbi:DsbA family protein [Paenibacillus sp. IHBB 10380]|uniref:DsbA family protein n=1 Tax=Paenibacillus sp. IHBB 10380 TaxID=1566358 RepID=UPI000696AF76|nr:DsbA family protein [Paenibacillus sp. IHBB 10380]